MVINSELLEIERPQLSSLNIKKFTIGCSPTELFQAIQERYEYAYLLESMTGPKKLAQFSFIGFMPTSVISVKDGMLTFQQKESNEQIKIETQNPFNIIKQLIQQTSTQQKFRFVGGSVGFISYDAVRYWEKIPNIAISDQNFPDIHMGIYNDGIVFDHIKGDMYYFFRDRDHSDELNRLIKETHEPGSLVFTTPQVAIKKDLYEERVERAKEYVAAGDIFQVVLSKRLDFKIDGDLMKFYSVLRKINPSPYMYFLKMGSQNIIGSSPEMLVRVTERLVETYPIAGTRPRLDDPVKNQALANELLDDPKERAEHVMLLDLGRNDIGKVSDYGSVRVAEFMQVHQYSHVQHIVSRVVGKLRNDLDSYDALKAIFPAGTVSGAPKVRAMEIIEESEPIRRGPYAGAVGYFSYNGNADFAITIRTLVADGRNASIQAGGGIVADSDPETEWFETEHKARALIKALELAED